MSDTKEITTKASGFLLVGNTDFAQIMAEELDGLDAGFERIKIPSGGSTVYEMPSEDSDEPEAAKEFSGVILYHHPLFAYYKDKYTGGSNPPDCGSFDGKSGTGDPGGSCEACPFNQYGSGENGGKACKNRRRVYILLEGELFPVLLSLPTGSLKEFTRYLKRQLSKGRSTSAIVTRFSLRKATNNNGLAYSQAQFALDRELTDEERKGLAGMIAYIRSRSKSVAIDFDSTDAEDNAASGMVIDEETGEIIEPLK